MSLDKIAIVVITYNPNLEEFKHNIKSYINQVPLIVIVDNSTNKNIQNEIKSISNEYNNIFIITLGDNLGIAKAQNIGIEQNFDYIIEMDQDSCLPNNYVNDIFESYKILESQDNKIAGIGPLAINKETKEIYHEVEDSSTFLIEVSQTLSSGFFIPKKSFEIKMKIFL